MFACVHRDTPPAPETPHPNSAREKLWLDIGTAMKRRGLGHPLPAPPPAAPGGSGVLGGAAVVAGDAQRPQVCGVKAQLRPHLDVDDVVDHLGRHQAPHGAAEPTQRLGFQMLDPQPLPRAVVAARRRRPAISLIGSPVGHGIDRTSRPMHWRPHRHHAPGSPGTRRPANSAAETAARDVSPAWRLCPQNPSASSATWHQKPCARGERRAAFPARQRPNGLG